MFKYVDIYESEKIHQYRRCCHNIYMELKNLPLPHTNDVYLFEFVSFYFVSAC